VIEIRNQLYEAPEGTKPTRLVASALLVDGYIWTGKRHFQLIRQVRADTKKKVVRDHQGFWTDDGRFVSRKAGLAIAISEGQIEGKQDLINPAVLTSEDLWE